MKAYTLTDATDDDKGSLVVFANTAKEAKQMDNGTIDPDFYIDLRVKRCPEFDGMENATSLELYLAMWREGWWLSHEGYPCSETSTDEEFEEWYEGLER